ncbi:MAG: hypothetical protein ACI957_005711 [Verrucomicrobiales bacterium]|jgi:hypothetical protein
MKVFYWPGSSVSLHGPIISFYVPNIFLVRERGRFA